MRVLRFPLGDLIHLDCSPIPSSVAASRSSAAPDSATTRGSTIPQIPELTALARAHPEVPIILDHLGGPLGIGPYRDRREEVITNWRSAMRQLAGCPNVMVKLGGIGMPSFGQLWHEQPGGATSEQIAAAYGAEIRWCIEQFGVNRCMFESNFPVDKVSCSYVVLWNAFKRIVADASRSEKTALFHDTAVAAYRL